MIESKFNFWPIGQGLFYTGNIDNGKFNFVYDCGSSAMVSGGKNALKKAIDDYTEGLKNGVDFMVVSHLDADHVNGIFDLMAKTHIEKLYLPYLGDSRRNELLIKLTIANAIIDDDDSGETYEKKFRILTEFYERNIEEKWMTQERKIRFIKFVGGKENQREEQLKIASKTSWEFRMFSREISEKSFNDLNDAIAKRLDGRTVEQLFLHWNSSSDPITKKLENLRELKKIYKDIVELSDVNRSSIILVHYPISDREESEIRIECKGDKLESCYRNCCERKCCRINESRQKPVTVLTGDAEFVPRMRLMLKDIMLQFHIKTFCVMQAPHHGARNEWEALEIEGDDIDVCIIPFGYGNTYGHPSCEIMRDLREWHKQGWDIAWTEVTQFNRFTYRIYTPKH